MKARFISLRMLPSAVLMWWLGWVANFTSAVDLTMTNGLHITLSENRVELRSLTLSNVWIYGKVNIPEETFWNRQGVTNTPINVAIPGKSHFVLFVADARVLPFVGRKGSATEPAAIWSLPALSVNIYGTKEAVQISACKLVSFQDEKLGLADWSRGGTGVIWRMRADSNGILCIELETDGGW